MVGKTISHYKILEKIGEGGMGVVYRAEDVRLRRAVALKVLRPEASEDRELKARLSKEAEVAAALDHPNITTVYEIDEVDGQTFLAMPLVEGQTLATKIKQRPLPLSEALDIAIHVAEALHAAHEKGVVHRDIKPANIMITPEGRVKVMDFGLAHLAGQTHITKTGTIMGTPAYMSPEQAQGLPADSRADVWALGVVLYEMVTGRQPFQGENSQSVMYSIIHEEHEPITALRVGVPPDLDRIVGKAMAKSPGNRFQHADDVIVDLRTLAGIPRQPARARTGTTPTRRSLFWLVAALLLVVLAVALGLNADRLRSRLVGGSVANIESIAILPLRNLSGDPEQKYFSDGMTEVLYTNLAKISALKVVSPRSGRRYEGTDTPFRQIAAELGVEALVEGSAVRIGDRVRITAQLIDAATDENLWAESYERDFSDVLALQNEISRAIAQQVQANLAPDEALRLASARSVNPEAYEAYLKGNFSATTLSRKGLDAALQYYELALEHDPGYAPAYAGIANVWSARKQMGHATPREATPRLRENVIKALELDSSLAEAQYALACFRTWTEWDWGGAEQAFCRAIEINPNYADALAFYSHFLWIMSRPEEAIDQIERALELDPLNVLILGLYGTILSNMGHQDEAISVYQEVLEIAPNHENARKAIGKAYHFKGMREEALAIRRENTALSGRSDRLEALSRGYAEGGYEGALKAFAEKVVARSRTTPVRPLSIARLYMYAGEASLALDWLERGYEYRDPGMPSIGVMINFASLHSEPRFQDLLRRMNLPQYQAVPGGN